MHFYVSTFILRTVSWRTTYLHSMLDKNYWGFVWSYSNSLMMSISTILVFFKKNLQRERERRDNGYTRLVFSCFFLEFVNLHFSSSQDKHKIHIVNLMLSKIRRRFSIRPRFVHSLLGAKCSHIYLYLVR